MDEISSEAAAVPRAATEREGPAGDRGDDAQGIDRGTHVEADADPAVARRRAQPDRDGQCRWDVSARGAAGGVALPWPWPAGGADRRGEADSAQAAGYEAGGSDRRDGVCAATRGVRALDDRTGDGGSETTRDRRPGGAGDDPAGPGETRAKAVAEKKCGASPPSTRSTWRGWRTC